MESDARYRCGERDDLKRRWETRSFRERGIERSREKRRLDRGVKVGTELLGRANACCSTGVGQARSQ